MVRRPAVLAHQRIAEIDHGVIGKPDQPAGAPAHRRLVDDRAKAARRHGAQHADRARPGDVVEVARRPGLPSDFDATAEPVERPVERAAQQRRAVRPSTPPRWCRRKDRTCSASARPENPESARRHADPRHRSRLNCAAISRRCGRSMTNKHPGSSAGPAPDKARATPPPPRRGRACERRDRRAARQPGESGSFVSPAGKTSLNRYKFHTFLS